MRLFHKAKFHKSAPTLRELPPESLREVAFAGRSNAGKSSVINTLAGQRQLARVSRTPGRTQMINYFSLGNGRYLVDLPGYGYARVPEGVRAPWAQVLGDYLISRAQLCGLIVVMDVRHPLTALDRTLLAWFLPTCKPAHIVLTKSDKISRAATLSTLRTVRTELLRLAPNWSAQAFSSLAQTGTDDAEAIIGAWLDDAPSDAHESI